MHTCMSNKYTGGTDALDLDGKPLMQKRYDMYIFHLKQKTYILVIKKFRSNQVGRLNHSILYIFPSSTSIESILVIEVPSFEIQNPLQAPTKMKSLVRDISITYNNRVVGFLL